MKATVKTLEVDYITKILEATEHQRPVNNAVVNTYATVMKAGGWKVNGESIILGKNGNGKLAVIDGQHRLWAALEANVPLESLVVEVDDASVFDTIDTGRARTTGDIVGIHVGKSGAPMRFPLRAAMGAAISIILRMSKDGVYGESKLKGKQINVLAAEWISKSPQTVEFWRTVDSIGRFPIPLSIVLAMTALTHKSFPNALEDFWRPLSSGENLHAGNPAFALREVATGVASSGPWQSNQTRVKIAMSFKAWNYYACISPLHRLMYKESEPFPALLMNDSLVKSWRSRYRSYK